MLIDQPQSASIITAKQLRHKPSTSRSLTGSVYRPEAYISFQAHTNFRPFTPCDPSMDSLPFGIISPDSKVSWVQQWQTLLQLLCDHLPRLGSRYRTQLIQYADHQTRHRMSAMVQLQQESEEPTSEGQRTDLETDIHLYLQTSAEGI
jgi:hypothetical protein